MTGSFSITTLPSGKYRFDRIVRDTMGNLQISPSTLYIDGVEWMISSPLYDIGGSQTDVSGFGSGELIITVRTVGAGFSLGMIRTDDLIFNSGSISVWDGVHGW